MTQAQALEVLKKYQFKHKSEQEQGAADIAQSFKRLCASSTLSLGEITEAMKGIVIMPQITLEMIKFLKTYRGPFLKNFESL